jgi:hypothetical protein
MRAHGAGRILDAVDAPARVRVVLEIERNGGTIRGLVVVRDEPATCFFGWLELLNALERARTSSDRSVEPELEP